MADSFRETRDLLSRMERALNPGSASINAQGRNAVLAGFSRELRKSKGELDERLQGVLRLVSGEQSLLSQLNHDLNAMRNALSLLDQAANWDTQSDALGSVRVAEAQFVANLKALKGTLLRVKEQSEGINAFSKSLGL